MRKMEKLAAMEKILAMGYNGNRELLSERLVLVTYLSCKCSELLFPYLWKKIKILISVNSQDFCKN